MKSLLIFIYRLCTGELAPASMRKLLRARPEAATDGFSPLNTDSAPLLLRLLGLDLTLAAAEEVYLRCIGEDARGMGDMDRPEHTVFIYII